MSVRITKAQARQFGLDLMAQRDAERAVEWAAKVRRAASDDPQLCPPLDGAPWQSWTIDLGGWRPLRQNELDRATIWQRSRLKKKQTQTIWLMCFRAGVWQARGKRRVELLIRLHRGRPPDSDAYAKALRDSLVRIGALVDDGPRWLEAPEPTYERGCKQRGMVLTITELGGDA